MRILHIFDHSLPLQSGYVSRSLSIIRSQQARGWQTIQMTTPRYLPAAQHSEIVDGLRYYRCRKVRSSPVIVRELLEMQATQRTLANVIRLEKPDILHAHSPVLTALPAIAAGRKFGLPVVYEVRALWEDAAVDHGWTKEGAPRYRAARWIETSALHRADRVVTLCGTLRDEIAARGICQDKIAVVPNAVGCEFLDPSTDGDSGARHQLGLSGRFVLGFIGSFYGYEGLDLLLGAVPRLAQRIPGLLVLLVGGGPEEDRLRRLAAQPGIEPFVRFTGRVHHSQVMTYYAAVDVMVFPRMRSRLTELVTPLKPLESMARAKPVVASDVGGHRELIRDTRTGYLFAADNQDAMVAKILEVSRQTDDRARVAANGRHFVETERTWARVVEQYASVYGQLIGRQNPTEAARLAA